MRSSGSVDQAMTFQAMSERTRPDLTKRLEDACWFGAVHGARPATIAEGTRRAKQRRARAQRLAELVTGPRAAREIREACKGAAGARIKRSKIEAVRIAEKSKSMSDLHRVISS